MWNYWIIFVNDVMMRPFPDPSILLHPQIPKPLHLLNPRTILGSRWWNEVRQEAYKRHDLCCHACGVHKYDAKHRQWLEAHEMYDIDFVTGRVEFVEIVALCHFCHNYIHKGRLANLLAKGEIGMRFVDTIIKHGNAILTGAGLPLDGTEQLLGLLREKGRLCRWEDYHMVINGIRYERTFVTYEDWEKHWSK